MRVLAHPGDLTAPSVAFTSPAAGNVSGTITISVNATDNYGVVGVQFKMDGSNIGAEDTAAPFSTTYDTHYLPNGGHTITAVARDAKGNTTTVTQNITVANSVPGAGYVNWGDLQTWWGVEGEEGWYSMRTSPPDYDHRWTNGLDNAGGWWSAPGQGAGSYPTLYLPGNPNPTYYQMKIQMYASRWEGGSEHNVVRMVLDLQGQGEVEFVNTQIGWMNALSPQGVVRNVNGGESMRWNRWANDPGWNSGFCQGVQVYYYFEIKPGFSS